MRTVRPGIASSPGIDWVRLPLCGDVRCADEGDIIDRMETNVACQAETICMNKFLYGAAGILAKMERSFVFMGVL